jgi:hypothetical protein
MTEFSHTRLLDKQIASFGVNGMILMGSQETNLLSVPYIPNNVPYVSLDPPNDRKRQEDVRKQSFGTVPTPQ